MMMKAAAEINWAYPGDAIPAFVTLLIMPMTYSIAYGLIAGIITYIILNSIVWFIEVISGGRIVPYAKEVKEPWTWRIAGGILPAWVSRLIGGKKDFWRPYETDSDYSNSRPGSKDQLPEADSPVSTEVETEKKA
jgi:AGZA family xanthine/uracil permease-like MFS transporter